MKNISKKRAITIDGGAATGKSMIASRISRDLNFDYLLTGKLYRLITLYIVKNSINYSNDLLFLDKMIVYFQDNSYQIKDFHYQEDDLFGEDVLKNIAGVSAIPEIRNFANKQFRKIIISNPKTMIIEGRDAGTLIYPEAELKFFLTVSDEEAAKRRFLQEQKLHPNVTYEQILSEVIRRNKNDQYRNIAPLIPASDAHIIDTTLLEREEIINLLKDKIKEL